MKRKYILYTILIITNSLFAQTNYQELLVRGQRTYWAYTKSLCAPIWSIGQSGICFAANGLYDRYEIPDDDTISYYDNFDTEMFISHRTYKLHKDTIFITCWHNETGNGKIIEAYKILYITSLRLVLLELKLNSIGTWEESHQPDCDYLRIREYKCLKP